MKRVIGTVVFFLVAPAMVAGVVPWWLTGWDTGRPLPYWDAVRPLGVVLWLAGLTVLIDAFVRFVSEGRGTPAPLAPTQQLVVGGLYRYVRNPMYLAVVAMIIGQALALGRPALFVYGAGVWLAVYTFVRLYEQPTLHRQFGEAYETYSREVPAWWPRLRPWSPDTGHE